MCVRVCVDAHLRCNIHDEFCCNLSVFREAAKQKQRARESGKSALTWHLHMPFSATGVPPGPLRVPKHFEVNKLLIFSISTDDSMVSSRETEKREEERVSWRRVYLADGAVSLALHLMLSCIWRHPLKTNKLMYYLWGIKAHDTGRRSLNLCKQHAAAM